VGRLRSELHAWHVGISWGSEPTTPTALGRRARCAGAAKSERQQQPRLLPCRAARSHLQTSRTWCSSTSWGRGLARGAGRRRQRRAAGGAAGGAPGEPLRCRSNAAARMGIAGPAGRPLRPRPPAHHHGEVEDLAVGHRPPPGARGGSARGRAPAWCARARRASAARRAGRAARRPGPRARARRLRRAPAPLRAAWWGAGRNSRRAGAR
jgi:hypothetical protein